MSIGKINKEAIVKCCNLLKTASNDQHKEAVEAHHRCLCGFFVLLLVRKKYGRAIQRYSDALDGWLSMGPFSFAGATSPPFSVWLVDLDLAGAAHHIGLRSRPAHPQAQQGKNIVQVYAHIRRDTHHKVQVVRAHLTLNDLHFHLFVQLLILSMMSLRTAL